MKIRLESERLIFREFTKEDAAFLYEMHQDPEILRYTHDPKPWDSVEATQKIIEEILIPQYASGIGRWAMHIKENGECIGWCGLKDIGDTIDLGYRIKQTFWRKGYASEAAKAVFEFGIKNCTKNIIGRANIANKASVAVLQKLAWDNHTFVELQECGGLPTVIYTREYKKI